MQVCEKCKRPVTPIAGGLCNRCWTTAGYDERKAWEAKMMEHPRVWNRKDGRTPKGAIYVGRPTPFGNRYSHVSSHIAGTVRVATREEAIARYRADLLASPELVARVKRELKGKHLVCWCAPLACHGTVLLEIANQV